MLKVWWRFITTGAADALGGVFAADEVAFDEDLFFERGEVLEVFAERVVHVGQGLDLGFELFEDGDAVGLFGPAGEGEVAQVAREPDAAADDDVVVRTVGAHPFTGTGDEAGEFHGGKNGCCNERRIAFHILRHKDTFAYRLQAQRPPSGT